jgi:transketolase
MTSVAGSGHPAGSLSSIDIYNMLLAAANITPVNCDDADRDRIVVSHGHTSPGFYAALAAWGFFSRDEVCANFRRAGSPYQGHVERDVRGVDWGTGNLGQGLAAGVGFAIANRILGRESRVFVVMGDGEQPKGQIAEARRVASKEGLSSVVALIDLNHIQISGRTEEIMPVDIAALWAADRWKVIECDGHNYAELYGSLKEALDSSIPAVILCRTVMGKGVSFMEGIPDYHGKPASGDLLVRAIEELGGDKADMVRLKSLREGALPEHRSVKAARPSIDIGGPIVYSPSDKKDCRSAFGSALTDVAVRNNGRDGRTPIIAFDCDLAVSVKLDAFAKKCGDFFFQTGIQEHATATIAGAASIAGVVPVWADFGVFGIDETYNQHRLNDINKASVKTVLTHIGLDVGEDGMTHQCVDYVSLFRNMFGWKVVVPADPNQTDRAARWMLGEPGNVCVAMGRSVTPVLLKEDGTPFFGEGYEYEYGKIDVLRNGGDAAIVVMGQISAVAVAAADELAARGTGVKVLNVSSPLGIDPEEFFRLISGRPFVTCEDHNADTGLASVISLHAARAGLTLKMKNLGVTRYGDSGPAKDVYLRMGLSQADIAAAVESLL